MSMNWFHDPEKKIEHIDKHIINIYKTENKADLEKMQKFFCIGDNINEYLAESDKKKTALYFNYSDITENIIGQNFDKESNSFKNGNWYHYTDTYNKNCMDFIFESGKFLDKVIPKHLMMGCQDHSGELKLHTCFIKNRILDTMTKMIYLNLFIRKYRNQFILNDEKNTSMKLILCNEEKMNFETNDLLFNESRVKAEKLVEEYSKINFINAFLMNYFDSLSYEGTRKGVRIIYKIMYHKYLEKTFNFSDYKLPKYILNSSEEKALKEYIKEISLLANKDKNLIFEHGIDFHEEFNYVERYLFYRLVNSAISYIEDNELEPIRLKEITILGLDPIEI